jgi:hypothetical protein
LATTIKYLQRRMSGAAGNGLGTTAKCLRQTTSAAAGNSLGTTITYLRVAAGIGLGTTIKFLRRTTRQRPGHHDQAPEAHSERRHGQRPGDHDQVPTTHNKRRRGQRPEPIPGIIVVLSPKRNTPKRAPPAAPPSMLPVPTAPTLHLSSTILRKASRSATEEEDSENVSHCLWLFRTRMPMNRRLDLL